MKSKIVNSLRLISLLKLTFSLLVSFFLTACTGTKDVVLEKPVPVVDKQTSKTEFCWDEPGLAASLHHNQDFTIYWLPLTRNAAYLNKVLAAAEDYQVAGFQMSDEQWPWGEPNESNQVEKEALIAFITKVRAANQEVWYLTRESVPELVPAGVNQEQIFQYQSTLKEEFKNKYHHLVKDVLPGLSGVILNLTEPLKPGAEQNFTSQNINPVQVLVSLVRNGVLPEQVCLAVRHPAEAPSTLEEETKVLAGLPADVIIVSKSIPDDGQPFYPLNPALGSFNNKEQWVEFDLGLENQGENILPYADPELYLQQLRILRDKGINTVCLRLDKGQGQKGKNALDTPWGQLNLAVFKAFKQNPQVSAEEIIAAWEKKQFPGAYKLIQLTTAIVRRAFFPKKLGYAHDSTLPDFDYITSVLTSPEAGKTRWSGAETETKALAAKPTLNWLKEIQAEDMANLTDLNSIEMTLGEKHVNIFLYTAWKEGLKALKIYVELFRLHKQAYFAIRLYQTNPAAITKEQVSMYLREFDSLVTFFSPLPENTRVQANVPLAKILASLKRGLDSSP